MRITLIAISVLLLLTGTVWILQGVNILPGSFMTGEIRWAYAGIVTALIGGGLLWIAAGWRSPHSLEGRHQQDLHRDVE